jgi:hypothetical protein
MNRAKGRQLEFAQWSIQPKDIVGASRVLFPFQHRAFPEELSWQFRVNLGDEFVIAPSRAVD